MESIEVDSEIGRKSSGSSGLTRKYGLLTAIAMVVGCVVGSGIFFRTGKVLEESGGNVGIGVLAWICGGLIMIVCAFAFATLAKKHEKVNGFTDYTEALCGKKFGYLSGWFMATIYGPATMAILPWVAAMFTSTLLGLSGDPREGMFIFALAAMYLALVYAMTVLAPKIAGYFQISTTIVKLIPIVLVGVVGIIVGVARGANIADAVDMFENETVRNVSIFGAIFSTAFAYAGWDAVAAINSEIKNSRRNLPIALTFGSVLIIALYVLYFLGVSGAGNKDVLMNNTFDGTQSAISSVFGSFASSVLLVFIIISCLGTTNGHTMATNRHIYSLSIRGHGPFPKLFNKLDKETNTPVNGSTLSFALTYVWLFVHMIAEMNLFGEHYLDISEITVFGFSAFSVPLFLMFVVKEKDLHWVNRFVFPILATLASGFLVVALFIATPVIALVYTIIILVVTAIGALFLLSKNDNVQHPVDDSSFVD